MILYRANVISKKVDVAVLEYTVDHIINEKERSEYLSLGDSR